MLTLATKITFVRVLLTPVFMVFLLGASFQPLGSYLAALIFSIAAITDTVDGYVARFQKQVTKVGQFLDPLADKLLVSAALISLVQLGLLSAWAAVVIVGREFAVSALRLVAAAENKVIVPSLLGKYKTFSQIAAIIALIIDAPVLIAGKSLGWILMAFAVVLTIISGFEHFYRARGIWTLFPSASESDEE